MKLTFDVTNDFESKYYLPGYDCVVRLEVKNGIVELNIEDDIEVDEDDEYDYNEIGDKLIEDDEFIGEIDEDLDFDDEEWAVGKGVIYTPWAYDAKDDDVEVEESDSEDVEEDIAEDVEEDVEEDIAEDEPSSDDEAVKNSDEYKFVEKLAKIDKDGVLINLLSELVNDAQVKNLSSKASRTFGKVIGNLAGIINK